MKRVFALILVLILTASVAVAELDLSDYTFDQLIELRNSITKEIMSRPEWKKVKVPEGTWKVGEDIPEGTYSISSQAYSSVVIIDEKGNKVGDHSIFVNLPVGKVILKDGWTFNANGEVYLAPALSLGF